MFRFCPACASPKISFEEDKVFRCPDCGFVYYHNTAAAAGCIISVPDKNSIVLLIRAKEPARGRMDLPGGFIDPGESALEGLRRECREELGWDAPDSFSFLASFPNVYLYKTVPYRTCDFFFTLSVSGLTENDFRLDENEIAGVRFVNPRSLNFEDLAFDSTRHALKAYQDTLY
jgi:8-oxo-dGTP pyrophosphatase MutT (NUDIX family)